MVLAVQALVYRTYSPYPAERPNSLTSSTGKESVYTQLRLKESLTPQSLSHLGLAAVPNVTDFGTVEFGVEYCLTTVIRNESRKRIIIEDFFVKTDEIVSNFTKNETIALRSKGEIAVNFCFTGKDWGNFENKGYFKTNSGVGIVIFRGKVVKNRFKIASQILDEEDRCEIEAYNPYQTDLIIHNMTISSPELSIIPLNFVIPGGESAKISLIRALKPPKSFKSTLKIISNAGILSIPVFYDTSSYELTLSPKIVDFGIVVSEEIIPEIPVSVMLYGDVYEEYVKVESDCQEVKWTTETKVKETILNVRFEPRKDGVYVGKVKVTVNETLSVEIPYIGIALFGFINFNREDLIFRPEDSSPRTIFLGLVFPSPVFINSITPTSRAFHIPAFPAPVKTAPNSPNSLYHGVIGISITFNSSIPQPDPPFLRVETEIGVAVLPLMVDEGNFTCFILEITGECSLITRLYFGNVDFGELRVVSINITNTGFFPMHIFVTTPDITNSSQITAIKNDLSRINLTNSIENTVKNPVPFLALPSQNSILIEIKLKLFRDMPEMQFSLHLGEHKREIVAAWSPLTGDVIVTPREIHLENVYFARPQTVSITIQHGLPQPLRISKVTYDDELICFSSHQDIIIPNAPIHVRDLTYPVYRHPPFDVSVYYGEEVGVEEVRRWLVGLITRDRQVKAKITFAIDGMEDVVVPFYATYASPELYGQKLDFGFVHLQNNRYIRVKNPSNLQIRLQLLLYSGKLTTDANITELIRLENDPEAGQKGSKTFYLEENSRKLVDVPPHQSVILGPIICRVTHPGAAFSTLYIRNNLTGFEAIPLSAQSVFTELTLETGSNTTISQRIDFYLYANEWEKQGVRWIEEYMKAFFLRNVGNNPLFIRNIVLENGGCELHGFELMNCHDSLYIPPNTNFPLTLRVKPTFAPYLPTLNLVLVAEEERLIVPIDFIVTDSRLFSEIFFKKYAVFMYWTLNLLISTAISVLVLTISDWVSEKKRIIFLEIAEKPVPKFSFNLMPLTNPLPKRHNKKKSAVSAELQSIQPPIFTVEVALPPEPLEEEVDLDEEEFLDDYKAKSGLFWGFRQDTD